MGHKSCDNGGISPISIEKEMQTAYLEYAMSVIVSRAIPDVRDGLKPVQRRILYAMYENGFSWNKAHKKSARVVGEVMSKYHPHGDSAIYDALVRMAQDFSMGAILIDGQGNFGSIDADPPAAMRYTEVRLAKITHTMLEDLSFDTVDFRDNYDGLEREPVVLPATYPNVLINGSEGIAVGMATNMPPYNLGEIIDACQMYISNPSISDIDLINGVKGPDFPTGSTMVDRNAITKAMLSGRGSIIVRGKAEITELRSGKEAIIITEIPYQVVKSRLIEKIAELVREKRIDGIASIRDESNKDGIRVVVETKRDASGEIVLNQLYKFTTLQSSFAVNMLVLNANKPELMNVCSIIRTFVDFRETLVSRRINHILQKTRNRAHMMLGLHVAVDSIDRVIAIIRESVDTHAAKTQLLAMEWPASESVTQLIALVCDSKNKVIGGNFYFTEEQVKSILEMRLSRLTGLERDKIITELQQLGVQIAEHLAILADRGKIMKIISTELECVKNEFAIPRRTNIEDVNTDASIEDLMERDDMLVAITNNGYIKRTSLKTYVAQRRGGKGKSAMQTRENDDVVEILVSHTHSYILFFSNKGRVYRIKTYKLPLGSNQSKGRAIVNLLPLDKDERVTNFLSVPENDETLKNCQMIFATKNGQVRRNDVADFANINANGKIAIGLDDGDALVGVCLARSNDNVLLATKNGMAIRFEVSSLRIVKSRSSDGVRGIMLDKNDVVISLSILANNENSAIIKEQYLNIPIEVRTSIVNMSPHELDQCVAQYKANGVLVDDFTTEHLLKLSQDERFLLTITHSGHGKRTSSYAYRITNRGGKGVINMDTTRGSVVATFVASDCDDIVLIASNGKIVRCAAESVPIVSRNTKGVRILHLAKDEKVVSISKIDNASYDDAIKDME